MIVLASGSPRRAKLLKDAGLTFKIEASNVIETFDVTLAPDEVAMYLAEIKAKQVASNHPKDIVIGADTIVVLDQNILGKPNDEDEAFHMLKALSDRCHIVYTGVSMIQGENIKTFVSQTKVCMRKLTEIEIRAYIKTKEPMDKAGAYGIQGEGGKLVDHYEGDFFTIMGLPLKDVLEKLKSFE